MAVKKTTLVLFVLGGLLWPSTTQAQYVNDVWLWGETLDATPPSAGSGAYINRLGGFGSAIWYDQASSILYAVPDAGPGGGLTPFDSRMQKFSLNVDPVTGELTNFALLDTIRFTNEDGTEVFTGQSPTDPLVLANSFDPEGLAMGPSGTFFVGDEFGPSIYEFALVEVEGVTQARLQRALTVPSAWLPVDADGHVNYTSSDLVSGRQAGRGIESLTISPDGNTLFALMQDPLINEGSRNGRNVRLARIDVTTGTATAEYVYQLESIDSINGRVPAEAAFNANQQGRNISANELFALSDQELLVLERDNRGIGVNDPLGIDPVRSAIGTKRVYKIDLSAATDVSGIVLPDTGELPAEVTAVAKSLYLDVDAALKAAGQNVVEKFEGLSMVPLSGAQPYALLAANDNDFSVLDIEDPVTGEITLLDICTDGSQIPMDDPLEGRHLLPSRVYSFAVPEPASLTLLLGLLGCAVFVPQGRSTNRGREGRLSRLPLSPNRTSGFPAYGSPVSRFLWIGRNGYGSHSG